VHELSSPQVEQSAKCPVRELESASWRIRELSSYLRTRVELSADDDGGSATFIACD